MTDYDLMIEQLNSIHAAATAVAAHAPALRLTLSKLAKPTDRSQGDLWEGWAYFTQH